MLLHLQQVSGRGGLERIIWIFPNTNDIFCSLMNWWIFRGPLPDTSITNQGILSRLHTSKFPLTTSDLENFICWCVKKNLSCFSLTSALIKEKIDTLQKLTRKTCQENGEIAGAQRSCSCDDSLYCKGAPGFVFCPPLCNCNAGYSENLSKKTCRSNTWVYEHCQWHLSKKNCTCVTGFIWFFNTKCRLGGKWKDTKDMPSKEIGKKQQQQQLQQRNKVNEAQFLVLNCFCFLP